MVAQQPNMDTPKIKKRHLIAKFISFIHPSEQKKAEKKKQKDRIKAEKEYKKELRGYHKRINGENDVGRGKTKTYKRMKRNERKSRRVNENKSNIPFYKRIFIKRHFKEK